MLKTEREAAAARKFLDCMAFALAAEGHVETARVLTSRIAYARKQIAAWDRLRAGGVDRIAVPALDGIPDALVAARIARGLTRRQLADRLGVSKRDIRRLEEGGYAEARLDDLCLAADALGLSISCRAKLAPAEPSTGVDGVVAAP